MTSSLVLRTALLAALAGALSPAASAFECDQSARSLPSRPAGGSSGSAFAQRVQSLSGSDRETAILGELLSGNLPSYLRHARPVELSGRSANGERVTITVCALPDYLAIGSDQDHLLMPMSLGTAWLAATRLGFALPTAKIVDALYQQARVKLAPQPMEPGPWMSSMAYYQRHNQMAQSQQARAGGRLGELTSGHKKDLVLTNRLWSHPGKVAIYGWHKADGAPIQPLSTVHEAAYADYSHGVRFIAPTAYVNGKARAFIDILRDPALAFILNDEGALAAG